MALILTGCAAPKAPQLAGHETPVFAYSRTGASDAGETARDILAALNTPGAVSLTETSFSRVLISDQSMPRVAAHEAGRPEAGKAENWSAAVDAPPAILAQGVADNAGWRELEGAFYHAYSGMTCLKSLIMFSKTGDEEAETYYIPLANITVFDATGHDTACNYEDAQNGVYVTIYASDWADISLADHYGAALRDILNRFTVVAETPTITARVEAEDPKYLSSIEGPTLGASFLLEEGQFGGAARYKTGLWLNKTGNWHIKARATFAVAVENGQAQFSPAELVAAIYHAAKLREVDEQINSGDGAVQVSY